MKILTIGAHPDDVELFCGGTLLKLADRGCEIASLVLTRGRSQRLTGSRTREQLRAWKFLGVKKFWFMNLKDSFLVHDGELVGVIDRVVKDYNPDVVFSHSELDHHQDHIAVARSVRSANRNWSFNWVTYCSYDLRTAFIPNFFVNIDEYFDKKNELLRIFRTQKGRWYFNDDVLVSRSLGTNVGKYVEAFRIEFGHLA